MIRTFLPAPGAFMVGTWRKLGEGMGVGVSQIGWG